MAGYMNLHDHLYIGTLTAAADTKPGVFVVPNFNTQQGAVPADNATADGARTYFVTNTPDTIDQELVNDTDYVVKAGRNLRLKSLKLGDILTTDQIAGTVNYANTNLGDVFAISANGLVDVIGTRTPLIKLTVKEKVSVYGKNGFKFVVTQA